MKARYENDPVRGPGYGLLYVEDPGTSDTDVRFAVVRSGDHKTLHPESWEDTEFRLVPDGVSQRGNELCLAIGPTIVRQLDELNTYRFVLFPPSGNPVKGLLELSGIIYPPEGGMGRVSAAAPVRPAPPPPPPAPEPGSIPQPEPEPAPISAPEPLPMLPPAPGKKGFPAWLIVLLLLLLAGGGTAWFMLQSKSPAPVAETKSEPAKEEAPKPEAPKEEPKQTEPKPEEVKPEQTPPEQPKPAEASPAPAVSATPMEQARQFLRGNGSAADGLALSRSLPQTPEGRDAAYLLLEAAAEQGQAEAMLALGSFYDPQDIQPKGSIIADPEQAWEWYSKAEKAGQTDAAARKQALRAWLEAEAGKGSAQAKALLSRIK